MNSEAIFRQGSTLLIIDCQTYWHTFAANVLQVAGYDVQTLESYEDVLPEVEKRRTFNLVILGCSNVAVSERLLITHLLAQHLHLIVLANTLTSTMIRALFLQGVDDAVEKTHDGAYLLSCIDQALERIAWRKQHQFLERRGV
jgi:DNA-binding NtrC family response regulator